MKNFVYSCPGGGPFSRFFQCGIVPLSSIEFDNVYLKLTPFAETTEGDLYVKEAIDHMQRHRKAMQQYGIDDPYDNILNYVLDQSTDHTFIDMGELPIGNWYNRIRKIENSPDLDRYKRTLQKIKIKNHIRNRADQYSKEYGIGPHTLGVHVRMTSMVIHTRNPDEENVKWENYYTVIDREIRTGNYANIFVASDNDQSLELIDRRYPNMVKFIPGLLRFPKIEIDNYNDWSWDYDQFFMKPWWEESFIEAMTLARCGGLICRESNLSNMAVVFSNSIRRVVRVYDAAN